MLIGNQQPIPALLLPRLLATLLLPFVSGQAYAVLHITWLTAVPAVDHRAAEAIHEMKALGMRPDVVVYSILLNAYLVSEDAVAAHQVLQDMKAAGVKPNNYTYGSLMAFHSQFGSVSKVQVSHLLPNHLLQCTFRMSHDVRCG